MTKNYPWAEGLKINPETLAQWHRDAKETPLLEWCLQHQKIADDVYLQWATEYYLLPSLSAEYFQTEFDKVFFNKVRLLSQWHQYLFPVGHWDGILFIACAWPPENVDVFCPYRLVLASPHIMSLFWHNLTGSTQSLEPQPTADLPPSPSLATVEGIPDEIPTTVLSLNQFTEDPPERADYSSPTNDFTPALEDSPPALYEIPPIALESAEVITLPPLPAGVILPDAGNPKEPTLTNTFIPPVELKNVDLENEVLDLGETSVSRAVDTQALSDELHLFDALELNLGANEEQESEDKNTLPSTEDELNEESLSLRLENINEVLAGINFSIDPSDTQSNPRKKDVAAEQSEVISIEEIPHPNLDLLDFSSEDSKDNLEFETSAETLSRLSEKSSVSTLDDDFNSKQLTDEEFEFYNPQHPPPVPNIDNSPQLANLDAADDINSEFEEDLLILESDDLDKTQAIPSFIESNPEADSEVEPEVNLEIDLDEDAEALKMVQDVLGQKEQMLGAQSLRDNPYDALLSDLFISMIAENRLDDNEIEKVDMTLVKYRESSISINQSIANLEELNLIHDSHEKESNGDEFNFDLDMNIELLEPRTRELETATTQEEVGKISLDIMEKYFEQNMILLFQRGQLLPWMWDSHWTPKTPHSNSPINLSHHSIFRVAHRTNLPYSGYIVPNDTNNRFFSAWNRYQLPNHISIIPLSRGATQIGMIVGTSTKIENHDHLLEIMQELSEHITQNLVRVSNIPNVA
jgi:hypothetical protein